LAVSPSGDFKSEKANGMNAILQFTFRESIVKFILEEVAEVPTFQSKLFAVTSKLHTPERHTLHF